MKSVKKFEEYEMDTDYGEIANEYSKLIVSRYIDKKEDDDETLESVLAQVVEDDELEEEQQMWIISELQDYLLKLYRESKKVRTLLNIKANKYNL